MKKKTLIIVITTMALLFGGVSIQAATTLESIQANLNHGISFLLNGKSWTPKDSNGERLVPISYKGTTYLPIRAAAEAIGVDVGWDGETQTISIDTEVATKDPVRKPFSDDIVSHVKESGSAAIGITQNKSDLLFGETQYSKAFMVTGINSAGQGVKFRVPGGTSKVGVLIGYRQDRKDKGYEATYTIGTKESIFATGYVTSGELTNNIMDLPDGVTELYLEFKGPAGLKGTGLLIWDESWVE